MRLNPCNIALHAPESAGDWSRSNPRDPTALHAVSLLCCARASFASDVHDLTYQVWVFHLFNHSNIIKLDIQVLIHALQCPPDRDIVLQFDGDLMVDQRLEEAEEEHRDR